MRVLNACAPYLALTVSLFSLSEGKAAETLRTQRLTCHVTNNANSTLLSLKVKGSDTTATLRLDWQTKAAKPQDFRNNPLKNNALVSTHRLGDITITRTILANRENDAILLHVHADQPGVVHFTTRFESKHPVEIVDRRQLVLSGDGNFAHVWVIPFESDVESHGKSTISLSGEGEALVVFNLTTDLQKHPIANTWERLGKKHDPAHIPPSPHLIWQGIQNEPAGEPKKP